MLNKLKGARAEYGLRQKDVAEKLGITKKTYMRKENGQTEFTHSEINKILNLFPNKSYKDIFLEDSSLKQNLSC